MVKAELDGLHNTLYNEFIGLRFFLVSPENTRTFEREKIFGEAVFNSFPSARKDAELSGTCLALGLADAAIFHLMRVTEIGLRALAKHLRVKDRVVEHATWGRIIGAMEIKKEELRKKSKSKKQNELLEFYSGILAELNGFKDVWRNNIMHTQKSYDIPEAQKVLMRVQDFVQRLAGRIKEK